MTTAAVPSTNPVDFLLNVETLDRAMNSTSLTFTDRLGNSKSTLAAAIDSIKAFNNRGVWAATTVYAGKDLVSVSGSWHVCVVQHTSSSAFATDTASKWRVYQGVTSGEIAMSYASDNAGTANLATPYASVSVNKTRTTINRHAFEDWSILNTTDTNLGYASFDAMPVMNNSLAQEHFNGYQARLTYSGSGGLTQHMEGFNSTMTHNGTGTIVNVSNFTITDVSGAGPVTNNYGIFIGNIIRGSATNWAIYSNGGDSYFKGDISTLGIRASALDGRLGVAYGADVATKNITYGYSVAGVSNFGTHEFYDGKNNLIVRFQSTGPTFSGVTNTSGITNTGDIFATGKIYSDGAVRPKTSTLSALPTGTVGEFLYVTNGRKVGEGSGAGTGVMAYFSNGSWRVFSTDAVVTA